MSIVLKVPIFYIYIIEKQLFTTIKTLIMKFKEYLIIFVITISSTFIYSQEVTIEDNSKGDNNYMNHPDYLKNRNRLNDVDKEIEKVLLDQSVYYTQNIKKPAFIYDNSGYSKEKLQSFLVNAKNHRNSLVNNSLFKQLCGERASLMSKVRPDGNMDRCKELLNQDLSSIDHSISQARDLLATIEKRETKKEGSIDGTNTTNSSLNTTNSTSRTNSNNSSENSQSNTTKSNNRSLSEALLGTWVGVSVDGTIHFNSNGTGYNTIGDTKKKCYPYYRKAHFNYSLNNSAIIQTYTSIDDYCGYTYSPTILSSLNLVIDSSGETLTDGEGNKFIRK